MQKKNKKDQGYVQTKRALGIFLVMINGVFGAFGGICGQYIFETKNANANWLVPIRVTIAGVIMLTLVFLRDKKACFVIFKSIRFFLGIVVYSIFGLMLVQYTYFAAVQHSNTGIASVIQYLSPAMVLLYVCIKKRRMPKVRETCALVLAIAGVFLLATHGDLHSFVVPPKALFWGLLSAAALSFYTVFSDVLLKECDSLTLIGWGMLMGGLVLMVVLKPWMQTQVVIDTGTIVAFAGLILCTVLAFNLYLIGMKWIGPSDASMLASVEPVASTFFAVVLMGVSFAGIDFAGIACIIGAVVILSIEKE